jgi:hypothetical protein
MIYFSDENKDNVISMINNCYPHISICHRQEGFKNVMFWRDFRRKVLSLYGISFKEYFQYTKEINKAFDHMENARMPQKTLDLLARIKGIIK